MPETDELVPRDAQAIIDVATRAATPKDLDPEGNYAVVVPVNGELVLPDLEHRLLEPKRKRGHFAHHTGKSFGDYVLHHTQSGTALFADVERTSILALLNGHADSHPGWGDHRAQLTLRHTPEWRRWTSRDGRIGSQTEFAEHLEDGIAEVAEPSGAEMLELAQTFHATNRVNFRQATVLASGQRQLTYEETIEARAGGSGQMTVPSRFVLGLAPFEGGQLYRLEARLRFRIREGTLAIGYILDRPEILLRTAFDDVVAEVQTITGQVAYRGWPAG